MKNGLVPKCINLSHLGFLKGLDFLHKATSEQTSAMISETARFLALEPKIKIDFCGVRTLI